jgi:pescadillo protein
MKQKRGKSGTAVLYATRNQALSKLQLRLSDFRRLCILKGIHPREPKRKLAGQNKTYYHVKDIAFLAHDPLLERFRAIRSHARKVRRAKAKGQIEAAQRLAESAPRYRLDSLVRERYPSLGDALRDLSDPLTLTHLFAVLPAERQRGIAAEKVAAARRRATKKAAAARSLSLCPPSFSLAASASSSRRSSRSPARCGRRSSP